MKSVDQFKFELYPLTPIFIGSDRQWQPNEYLLSDGRIVKVKIDQIMKKLYERSEEAVDEFARASAGDLEKAVSILQDEMSEDFVQESYPIMTDFKKVYDEKLATSSEILSVRLPCRYGPDVYIPGTSLKGAIRTTLYALMGQERNHPSERELFGYKYPFDDPFKRFKISDVNAKEDMMALRTLQRYNIKDNKPGGPDSYAICLNGLLKSFEQDPAEVASIAEHNELKLTGDVQFITHFEKMAEQLNVQSIINATKTFSQRLIQYEMNRPVVGKWYSRFFEGLGQIMQRPDVTLVRVGSGSGRMGTSILLYNEQAVSKATGDSDPHPVTRQLADGIPMGWALIRFLKE